jgi:hypothetical protein
MPDRQELETIFASADRDGISFEDWLHDEAHFCDCGVIVLNYDGYNYSDTAPCDDCQGERYIADQRLDGWKERDGR